MFCPVCATDLILAERQGVEIHVCPICRGMWLESDELDAIIERSVDYAVPRTSRKANPAVYFDEFVDNDNVFYKERRRSKKDKKQRMRSTVKELYDIFD